MPEEKAKEQNYLITTTILNDQDSCPPKKTLIMAKSKKVSADAEKQPAHSETIPSSTAPGARVILSTKGCADPSLEAHLLELANSKHAHLEHCDERHNEGCPCSSPSGSAGMPTKVDLVILIDTSGSMGTKAQAINDAALVALGRAQKLCNVDLLPTWLGIEATFNGTEFNQTCRDFLINAGCGNQIADPQDTALQGNREEGADSITDLCNCPNIWREGACRAIFYISDEPLNQGAPQGNDDTTATQTAIAAAQANNVKVFAHLAPGMDYDTNPATIQNYMDLCNQTGGEAFIGNPPIAEEYESLLEIAICQACGSCATLELPAVSPCFSVSWGDSDCDCMETNDFELLLIKACNCYSNVAFHNLTISRLTILDSKGNEVAQLPDGTPSVEVLPSGPICFGELPPCSSNTPSCKVREIVIRTRGAIPGNYQLKFENICFELVNNFTTEQCFTLSLCRD